MDSDVIHEFGENKDWNESFYFNLYDRGNDILGFMRVGLVPNKKEKTAFCFFLMPDGSTIGTKSKSEMADNDLVSGGLRLEKMESEKKWAIRFEGELPKHLKDEVSKVNVKFDLEFDALNGMFDYRNCVSGEKEILSLSVASEHLEQFGKVKGTIKIGDREYAVDALGERDHSWGVRDWSAPGRWVWITCQFNEGYAFNITKLYTDKGEVDAGFIHQDGVTLPIVKVDMAHEFDAEGTPSELYLAMYDKDGDVYGVKAVVKRKVMLAMNEDEKRTPVIFETLAKFKLDDDVGYGVLEYLLRK